MLHSSHLPIWQCRSCRPCRPCRTCRSTPSVCRIYLSSPSPSAWAAFLCDLYINRLDPLPPAVFSCIWTLPSSSSTLGLGPTRTAFRHGIAHPSALLRRSIRRALRTPFLTCSKTLELQMPSPSSCGLPSRLCRVRSRLCCPSISLSS